MNLRLVAPGLCLVSLLLPVGSLHAKESRTPATADSKGASEPFRLSAIWSSANLNQELKTWTLPDLLHLKRTSSRERDPITGKIVKWDGVLLSTLIENVLAGLPLEKRAQIDLVILRNRKSESAQIPRAFIGKYPILLAFLNESEEDTRGPLYSIVPWSSKPRIMEEDLPLERFFIPGLRKIELTNYREQFSSLFLKRRTDPSAMRGEKLFVQNCGNCHITGLNSQIAKIGELKADGRSIAGRHPSAKVSINLKLKDKDWKSIERYLDAHRLENPLSVSKALSSEKSGTASAQ